MQRPRNPALAVLLIVALLLPWLIFLFLPGRSIAGHALFWLAMLFCLLLIWLMSAAQRRLAAAAASDLGPRMLNEAEQPEAVRQVMDVRIAIKENGVQLFRGPLRESASASFEKLNRGLPKGFVPLVQEDDQLGAKIVLIPKPAESDISQKPVRPWLHWLLFGLTVITTTWAGASAQGVDLAQEPGRFAVGLGPEVSRSRRAANGRPQRSADRWGDPRDVRFPRPVAETTRRSRPAPRPSRGRCGAPRSSGVARRAP